MNDLLTLLKFLINYKNRMKTIHWNVCGKQFDRIHETTDNIHDMLSSMIDAVGEIIKVLGGTPDFSNCSLPDDDNFYNLNFDASNSWNCISDMIKILIGKYNEALKSPNLLEGIKSKLGDDQYTLIVEMYKLRQRTCV